MFEENRRRPSPLTSVLIHGEMRNSEYLSHGWGPPELESTPSAAARRSWLWLVHGRLRGDESARASG